MDAHAPSLMSMLFLASLEKAEDQRTDQYAKQHNFHCAERLFLLHLYTPFQLYANSII